MSEDAINSPMMDFIKKQYSGEKYPPFPEYEQSMTYNKYNELIRQWMDECYKIEQHNTK